MKSALLLPLLVLTLQPSQQLKVGRVFVATPYNASIIFEYAKAIIPEGVPFKDEKINCFVSALKETGLFNDVQVKVTEDGQTADIEVIPTWSQEVDTFLINKVVFEGFQAADETAFRRYLRRQGVKPGARLFAYPLSKIQAMLQEAAVKIAEGDLEKEEGLDKALSNLSFQVKVIAPQQVQVKIVTGNPNDCS
ncbi:MAG TPA: hypothetical protein VNO70_18690 [Blastocatellia bacterium]|nr:hypothetical protein [Blastocatellia bacterium]